MLSVGKSSTHLKKKSRNFVLVLLKQCQNPSIHKNGTGKGRSSEYSLNNGSWDPPVRPAASVGGSLDFIRPSKYYSLPNLTYPNVQCQL